MITVAKSARYPREMLRWERGSAGVTAGKFFTELNFAGLLAFDRAIRYLPKEKP
jgi:hypothetical protein